MNTPKRKQGSRRPTSKASRETVPPTPGDDLAETIQPRAGDSVGMPATSEVSPSPKQLGRYRIESCLGQGAMGSVYKAHDTQLDRVVALKIPKFESSDAPMLERFFREARAAATLTHPNICPVYDVAEIDGTYCISMGYIEGQPLSAFVRPEKPVSQKQAVQIVRKLAAGLNEAHSHGVIHRDLKPDNVMIDQKSNPVIMDFGLARRTSTDDIRVTQGGQMIGTPAYMSPEQVDGDVDRIGPRSDIYSVGVILYELLTGRLPYQGSIASVLAQIIKAKPTPPSEFRHGINPELQAICLKMMADNPDDRYASIADVGKDLTALLKGKPTSVSNSLAGVASDGLATGDEGISQLVSAEDHPLQDQIGARSRSKASKFRPVQGIIAAVVVVGLLAGYLLFVKVGDQSVRLKIDDPKAQVFVDGDEVRIENLGATLYLKPGKHGVEVRRGDLVVKTDSLTVFDGDNPVLQLDVLEPETLPVPGPNPKPSTKPGSSPKPGQPSTSAAGLSIRAAAEWALGVGMVLRVGTGGKIGTIGKLADLPPDPLMIRAVMITDRTNAPTDDWQRLSEFPDLKEFHGIGRRVDDEVLAIAGQLPKLELVDLFRTRVTDAGLAKLVGLKALKRLRVGGMVDAPSEVTDAAAATFLRIPSLESLHLATCQFTDAVVPQLARMPALTDLHLHDNPITDAAIPSLKPLKLKGLGLGNTKITDASAVVLNELTTLKTLVLISTSFSDEGLRQLTSLKLINLALDKCPVTQDAVGKWLKAHPDTQVSGTFKVATTAPGDPQPDKPTQPDAPTQPDDPMPVVDIPEAFAKSDDPFIQAVAWALSRGFVLTLNAGDETITTSSFDTMPQGDYIVEGLSVMGAPTSPENDWQHLKEFRPSLQELTVNHSGFTDAAIDHLSVAPLLQRLNLESSGLTPAGFAILKKLPELAEVTVGSEEQSSSPKLDAKSIEHLASISTLETIRLDGVPLQDDWLKPLSQMAGLRTLSLSSTGITNAGVAHLRGTKLMELDLSDNRLPDTVTLILTDIKPLASLDLSGTDVGDPSCKQIVGLPRLRVVNLSRTKVTNLGLTSIATAKKLQSLSLDETSISNAGLTSLTKLKLLRNLSIKSTRCSIAGVDDFRKKNDKCQLAYSPSEGADPGSPATTISVTPVFTPVSLDEQIPEAFRKSEVPAVRTVGWLISRNINPVIQYRTVTGTRATSVNKYADVPKVPFTITQLSISTSSLVTKDDWAFLKSLPNITSISTYIPAFNDDALKLLVGHPNLTSVYLRQTSVTDDGLKFLAGIPRLQSLAITGTRGASSLPDITDSAVPAIAQVAGRLSSLTLSDTLITNAGFRKLVGVTGQLRSLTISGELINDDGISAIKGHPGLSHLSVNGPEFSDAAIAVAATIPQLASLNLSETSISDDGLRALAGHPRLATIYLSATDITDNALLNLQKIPNLSNLTAGDTEISDTGLQVIAQFPRLTYVYLDGSRVTVPAAQGLQNARPTLRVYLQGVKRPPTN